MPARDRSPDSTEYKIRAHTGSEAKLYRASELSDQQTSCGKLVKLEQEIKMNKLKYLFFATLAVALSAIPAMAQAGGAAAAGADNEFTVGAAKAIGAGIGFGIVAGLAGIGQGLVGSRAVEGAARNPGAAGTVQTLMIIALALIESLVLFALLIVFVVLR